MAKRTESVIAWTLLNRDGEATVSMVGACGLRAVVKGVGNVDTFFDKLSDTVRHHAMVHGIKQRIGDTAARTRDQKTFKPATPEQKFDFMKKVSDHLQTGTEDWGMRAAGVGDDTRLLVAAIMELFPKNDEVRVFGDVKAMSERQRAALLVSPEIKPIAERLRAAAVADVDTTSLLAGFATSEDDETNE
jgi:hypothetical protein